MVKGLILSLSIFTRLKVSSIDYDDSGSRWILFFLPIAGLILGCLWFLVAYLFKNNNSLLIASLLTAFPYGICGFIHLDGFMDCCDALLSSANFERRIEILKDSQVGAFSVIALVLLILINFSSIHTLSNTMALIFIPIIARVFSVEMQFHSPVLSCSSMSKYFMSHVSTSMKNYFHLYLLGLMVLGYYLLGLSVFILMGYSILHFLFMRSKLMKQFKGINGDMCGFMIETMQCGLLVVACFI